MKSEAAVVTGAAPHGVEKTRITDRIFDELREKIISGDIRRGSKLPTERQLAAQYSASVPTVREAIRGLAVSGLVEVRHGSGAYVSATNDSMVAMALGSVMRLQDVRARDALDLVNLFIEHATAVAVAQASSADLRRLREAAEACADRSDIAKGAAAIKVFHRALMSAGHNPLLIALSDFLVTVQTEFMGEAASYAPEVWRALTANVQAIRMEFVQAIEARRIRAAITGARAFAAELVKALEGLERAISGDVDAPTMDALMARTLARIAQR